MPPTITVTSSSPVLQNPLFYVINTERNVLENLPVGRRLFPDVIPPRPRGATQLTVRRDQDPPTVLATQLLTLVTSASAFSMYRWQLINRPLVSADQILSITRELADQATLLYDQAVAIDHIQHIFQDSASLAGTAVQQMYEAHDPLNILPYLDLYNVNQTEMLFNVTDDMVPDIRTIATDPLKLERCA